jgi:integrase
MVTLEGCGIRLQDHDIVITAITTGLRQGELLRLSWADVDWNVGVLTVHETKAGERRRVPMNSTVVGLLSILKQHNTASPVHRIFQHDGRYLRRAFDRAVKAAGLAPFRFHDLRHTFASRLAMQGANDRTLMALGGGSPRSCSVDTRIFPRLIRGRPLKD